MSAIETAASPRSLNSRLAASSSRERICRPAVRVARTVCLGSAERSLVEAPFMRLRLCAQRALLTAWFRNLYVIQTNLSSGYNPDLGAAAALSAYDVVPHFDFYPTNEPSADMMKLPVKGLKVLTPGPSTATITRISPPGLLSQRVSVST